MIEAGIMTVVIGVGVLVLLIGLALLRWAVGTGRIIRQNEDILDLLERIADKVAPTDERRAQEEGKHDR